MDYYDIIAGNFQAAIETIALSVDDLPAPIEGASQVMTQALLEDRKIIACGHGSDGAVAQLFATNLLNRFENDRPALPALALGGDGTEQVPGVALRLNDGRAPGRGPVPHRGISRRVVAGDTALLLPQFYRHRGG